MSSLETPNAVETLKNTVKQQMTQEEINKLKSGIEQLTPEQQAEFEKFLSETTTNAKEALLNLKEDIPKDTISVSPTFANLMKENQELARMGARIEGNQIILPQGFEHQEKIKKLERVIYYIDFLSQPIDEAIDGAKGKHQAEKLKIYFELVSQNTDWILDRRFLKMKYIASMYEDIRNEGGVLVKEKNQYKIEKDGKPVENHPYAKLLDPTFVNQNDLDFAVLFSIANTDNRIEQEGFVTQKGLIKSLLEKHRIVTAQSDGEELQEAELLLIDWTSAEEQINEKMNAAKTSNKSDYQELVFLKNYINQKEYLSVEYNRNLFTDVNEYRNLYLAEKGLYDVLKANNGKNMTPENYGDMIANTAKEYQLPLGALGILLLLFKDTRKWGLGALGAAIGLPIVGGIASKVENAAKGNKSGSVFTDEQLGLLKLRDIKPFTEDLRSEETPVLQAITAKNEEWRNNPSAKHHAFYYPQTLTATYKAIKGIDAKTLQDISVYNITSQSDAIFKAIKGDKSIEGLEGTTITKDDVTKLLRLLSATKDLTDDNLLDMVVEGKHILNTPYKAEVITNTPFDNEIHNVLKSYYTPGDATTRKDINDIASEMKTENNGAMKLLKDTTNSIQGSGETDPTVGMDLAWDNILNKADSIHQNLPHELGPIIEKYKAFQKAETEMTDYKGIFDENISNTTLALAKLLGIIPTNATEELSEQQKITLEVSINSKIDKLTQIDTTLQGLLVTGSQSDSNRAITEKSAEISRLIGKLNDTKTNLIESMNATRTVDDTNRPQQDTVNDFNNHTQVTSLKERVKTNYDTLNNTKDVSYSNYTEAMSAVGSLKQTIGALNAYRSALPKETTTSSNVASAKFVQNEILLMLNSFDEMKPKVEKKIKDAFDELQKTLLDHSTTLSGFNLDDFSPTNIEKLQGVANFLQKNGDKNITLTIPETPFNTGAQFDLQIGQTLAEKDKEITLFVTSFKEVFGQELTNENTFTKLQDAYNTKKAEFDATVKKYINEIKIDGKTFTSEYKKLAQLEVAYKNDSSLLGTIQAKKEECRKMYFKTTKVVEILNETNTKELMLAIPPSHTTLPEIFNKLIQTSSLDSFILDLRQEYEITPNRLPENLVTIFERIKQESIKEKLN